MPVETRELPVVFLMGPTASGKTDLAVRLCQHLPFDIISVDSAMVYKGMDIGTAKPDLAIRAIAPHRLIDVCEATEIYSAGRFRDDARLAIDEIVANGRIPLLVGGTGLYFRALEQGISELPGADQAIRERLEREAAVGGWTRLHRRLQSIDPDSAQRIHPNDPQRIQRALEVYEITGKSLTEVFASGRQSALNKRIIKLIISPLQRDEIHARVKTRFHKMVELGFIDEVRKFYTRDDMDPSLPSMRMVGYRQAWRYLDGILSYQEMQDHAIIASRQLAKRQVTWLRSEQAADWVMGNEKDNLDNTLKVLQKDPVLTGLM